MGVTRRRERGQLVAPELLATAAVLAATALGGFGLLRAQQAAEQSRALEEARAAATKSLQANKARTIRVEAPPEEQGRLRDCHLAAGQRHGLTWTNRGWRHESSFQEPPPIEDPEAARAALDEWQAEFEAYVKSWHDDFERCEYYDSTTTTGAAAVTDTYDSIEHSVGPGCLVDDMSDVFVTREGSRARIRINFGPVHEFHGEVSADGSFDLSTTDRYNTGEQDHTFTGRVRGRFDTFEGQKLIRSGIFDARIDDRETCTWGFEGRARP